MAVSIDEMAANWRRRQAEAQARGAARAAVLLEKMPAAKRLLVDKYGARRVVLFGSVAPGNAADHRDVDLAVEGLPNLEFFPAMSALWELFECPPDLVELETAPEWVLARLRLEGREL